MEDEQQRDGKLNKRLSGDALDKALIKLRKSGKSSAHIEQLILNSVEGLTAAQGIAYAAEIKQALADFQNTAEVDRIIASDICKIADSDKYFIYDPVEKDRNAANASTLNMLFYPEYLFKKTKIIAETYDPYTDKVYLQVKGREAFNVYRPADWYAPYFYGKKVLEPCDIPPIYKDFFMHLVDNDKESYEYLLKWMSYSLKNRNYTYLVTVGAIGIGKGLLYKIFSLLHGIHNSGEILGKTFFESGFNSEMEYKTLFYIDEITKLATKQTDQLKKMVSDTIRIEAKGKDAKSVLNTINLMMSSNDMTCLQIPPGERRYSIIRLTKTKILDHWKDVFEENHKLLKSEENIKQLGLYLLTKVETNHEDMKRDFKSKKQLEEIAEDSIQDWEDHFIYSFCRTHAGETIPIVELAAKVQESANTRNIKITRKVLRDLKQRIPGFFKETIMPAENDLGGASAIKITALSKQPKKPQNLNIIESED